MGIHFPTEINRVLHHARDGQIYQLDSFWKMTQIYNKLQNLGHKIEEVSHDITQKVPKEFFLKFHTPEFVEAFFTGKNREFHIESCGVFWQPILIPAMYNRALAVSKALENILNGSKSEVVIADGGHHTTPNNAYGFGPINPIGITLNDLKESLKDRKIVILDLDVHQGNGFSFIEHENVKIFDIWGKNLEKWEVLDSNPNYYSYKVSDYTSWEESFKKILNDILDYKPDILIYYAGVDVLDSDRMGGIVGFNEEKLTQREESVFSFCRENNISTLLTLGGGYIDYKKPDIDSERQKIVDYHIQTIQHSLK